MGQKDLGDVAVVFGEEPFVGGHEAALADGGTGLQLGEFAGALGKTEGAHTGTDRAGGDEDDFLAGLALGGDLADDVLDLGEVQLLLAVGQNTRAELHHDSADILQTFLTHTQSKN